MLFPDVPKGIFGERNFRLFFFGYLVSLTGSAMVPVALTFAILECGGSAGRVGLVLGSETAALVLLLLAGGVVGDRLSRKTVMVTADLGRCVAQALLAALLFSGHASLWLLMGLAVLLGAGQAFFGPALTGLVPEITGAARLQDANAWLGTARSLGQIAGPALAGLVVAAGGAPWAILIDAFTYAVGAACLAAVDLPAVPPAATEPFLLQLKLGWTEFRSHRWLWIIVTQFGFYHMLVLAPLMVLGAVIAERSLGGAAAWGLILSGQGLGAVIGGVSVLRRRPGRPLAWATVATFMGVPMIVLLAWPGPLWAIAAAAACSGAGFAIFTVLFDTTMQREIPPAALSRVSSYEWLGSFALLPIGSILTGPISALLGTSGTLWFSAVWLMATSALVLSAPAVHRLRWRQETTLAATP
ncbi:MFS transporter [Lichenifustis flavocetrariae]|uniref:MFS transporter n=1 Tax=Lichenifustis flavocetrariae TaxID=2949735 RepID=A0AA41Z0H5_9HYPH|nr:MFS transporter [Lichenifustis flavocetrariae]MCW6510657.1 MFS transporter [Lichenifustis flavocetrariae]